VRHLPGAGGVGRGRDGSALRPTDEEVESGYVLTCQSVPKGEGVDLDYDA
jgi:hypothetical protein